MVKSYIKYMVVIACFVLFLLWAFSSAPSSKSGSDNVIESTTTSRRVPTTTTTTTSTSSIPEEYLYENEGGTGGIPYPETLQSMKSTLNSVVSESGGSADLQDFKKGFASYSKMENPLVPQEKEQELKDIANKVIRAFFLGYGRENYTLKWDTEPNTTFSNFTIITSVVTSPSPNEATTENHVIVAWVANDTISNFLQSGVITVNIDPTTLAPSTIY